MTKKKRREIDAALNAKIGGGSSQLWRSPTTTLWHIVAGSGVFSLYNEG